MALSLFRNLRCNTLKSKEIIYSHKNAEVISKTKKAWGLNILMLIQHMCRGGCAGGLVFPVNHPSFQDWIEQRVSTLVYLGSITRFQACLDMSVNWWYRPEWRQCAWRGCSHPCSWGVWYIWARLASRGRLLEAEETPGWDFALRVEGIWWSAWAWKKHHQ